MGEIRLRVAGSGAAVPRPGTACSCYLIEAAGTRLILDCGTGALQSLQRYVDPLQLDAVLISHFHPDHVFDLVPLRYLRAFADGEAEKLDVFIHKDGLSRLQRLASATASSEGERFFERSMRVAEYDPLSELRVRDLAITFAPARHYIEAYAMRVTDGRASIVYSADTAPCDSVVSLARAADVFVCECALGESGSDRAPRGHCNAAEAGRMAQQAGVKHLVLSHYGSGSSPEMLAAAASREYSGRVSVAEDGWCATL